jgi:PIN domain nuclease of toxin-antitoxin system
MDCKVGQATRQEVKRVHLDTHIAVRLAGRDKINFSNHTRQLIDSLPVVISPIVVLELELLAEVGRLKVSVDRILELLRQLGAAVLEEGFPQACWAARGLAWTRDPFDRLIVGHALADEQAALVSFDDEIQRNYKNTVQ